MSDSQDFLGPVFDRMFYWNRKDPERCGAALHPDVIYDLRGPKAFQVRGRDTIVKVCAPWFERMPDNRVRFRNIIRMGNQVVTEMESQEIDLETGEESLFCEINFWEIKDGALYRLISYRMDPKNMTGDFSKLTDAIIAGKYKQTGEPA
ncbi:MAG: nuclear transport factor 2 family protein [Gammaproteobacteria bacterium]